jgi:hypothetical protein
MIGKPGQHVRKLDLGIDLVHLAGLDKCIDSGGTMTSRTFFAGLQIFALAIAKVMFARVDRIEPPQIIKDNRQRVCASSFENPLLVYN